MNRLTEVRPKLKQDSIFLETREGVFLRSDTTTFLLKGKAVYRWLSALSPYMTGERMLSELCEGLEPSQQDAVSRLVDTLLQRGVIKNHVPEAPELLSDAVSRHFRAQIELIDHYVDQPVQRFKTFRESSILLIGSGETFAALATSLLRNGLQTLYLAHNDEPGGVISGLEAEIALLRADGNEPSVHYRSAEDLSGYDMVVYCADESSLKEIADLQQRCLQQQQTFLPAVVFGGQALLGPLVRPQRGPCWMCTQMRVSANASPEQSAAIWRALTLGHEWGAGQAPLFTPQARMLGNSVGFEIFKQLTECLPAETVDGLILQDLETLEVSRSPVIRHPLCPLCSHADNTGATQQLYEVVAGNYDQDVTLGDEALRRLNLLIDRRSGVFQQFTDEHMMQLPLKASRFKVGSPASPLSPGFEVTTYSTETLLEARSQAAIEAIGKYTSSLPDARTMLSASIDELEQSEKIAIAPQQLSIWSGSVSYEKQTRSQWVPAFSVLTWSLCYVPAAAAYTLSGLNQSGLFTRTLAGLATHTRFQDLLLAGTTSAFAYEHIRELVQGRNAVVRLKPETLEGIDTNLTFLLRNAAHLKRPFELLEVLTPSSLHLILAYTTDAEEQPVAVFGWGLSAVEAASSALLHLVASLQFLTYEGKLPDLAINAMYPEFSIPSHLVFAETTSSRVHQPATTLQALQAYLVAEKRDLLFVHTTTADILESASFLSGVVLLTQPAIQFS